MNHTRTYRVAAVILGMGLLGLTMVAGCKSNDKPRRQSVSVEDFHRASTGPGQAMRSNEPAAADVDEGDASIARAGSTEGESAQAAPQPDQITLAEKPATQRSEASEDGDAQQQVYVLDAMVGQVNGRAIYASHVFEPIGPQLAALGKSLPPSIFKQRATELIVGQLQTIVTNALILGEAERDLSIQERYGLVAMLQTRREELLRQFGEGSESVADSNVHQRTGKGLDEQLKNYREQVLVSRYINNHIGPKINVSRKDIERYYENNYETYNPPAGRTLRLIMVGSQKDAQHIQAQLAAGQSFDEVAKSPANQYRASQGGLMADRITGEKFSGYDALNQAMVKLEQGQHSPMVEAGGSWWWVKVETYESGKGRSLEQVQLEIRQLLENQQRNSLGLEFRRKLLDEGSYNPIGQMTDSLVQIAMSRYSQPLDH